MRYKKDQKKEKGLLFIIIMIIIVFLLIIFLYNMYLGIDIFESEEEKIEVTRVSKTIEVEEKSVLDVIEDVTKSVVGISKIKNTGTSIFLNDSAKKLGIGTGVIVSNKGYILTNWHVAGEKFSNSYITLEDGMSYNGSVVWSDKDLDLAMIKINAVGLNYINLGDSDTVRVGENVYAIGNPIGFEFQRTVTSGIVSAINRTVKIEEENEVSYMSDLIQTDATINPGNSGGPLINEKGEMIGLNSIKIETAESIGFAIPINIIKPIINKYIKDNDFEEPYIGIFAYDSDVIPFIDNNIDVINGIYVANISLDSPCFNSGLKVGDMIIKIDDYEINKMSKLREYIYTKNVGDEVSLTIKRGMSEKNIIIKLAKK